MILICPSLTEDNSFYEFWQNSDISISLLLLTFAQAKTVIIISLSGFLSALITHWTISSKWIFFYLQVKDLICAPFSPVSLVRSLTSLFFSFLLPLVYSPAEKQELPILFLRESLSFKRRLVSVLKKRQSRKTRAAPNLLCPQARVWGPHCLALALAPTPLSGAAEVEWPGLCTLCRLHCGEPFRFK